LIENIENCKKKIIPQEHEPINFFSIMIFLSIFILLAIACRLLMANNIKKMKERKSD
jgi:hypothetical protein